MLLHRRLFICIDRSDEIIMLKLRENPVFSSKIRISIVVAKKQWTRRVERGQTIASQFYFHQVCVSTKDWCYLLVIAQMFQNWIATRRETSECRRVFKYVYVIYEVWSKLTQYLNSLRVARIDLLRCNTTFRMSYCIECPQSLKSLKYIY